MLEDGVILDNIECISKEIKRHFGKLFSKPSGGSWRLEGLDWSPISIESAFWLDCPFSKEEILNAVDNPRMVAHTQGLSPIILRVFLEFHNNEIINQSTNATFIALVPIKSQTSRISYYRPINLVYQFVQNDSQDEKRRSREEGVVFKIDFEKAYDHVDWEFLDHVLERKGFSLRWRSWMRGCLSSTTFAILVNGNAKGWVKAIRGLRQGDPLSPFLFTIVVDVLSRLVVRAEERGLIEGLGVGRNRTRVSHLQFADDTVFFSRASLEELLSLKLILLVFGLLFGLRMNLNKSTLSGINSTLDQTAKLA
ncbi:putative mitochondrial protein [Vitis vinifera]|uniref:Putative mitochondrial protein n=1 Tax=Vitis vinifera TaxID=29760 RepID=A0A438CNU7_VITVI|nr:putative mitochondrial protein [Vitis vinifera]